MTPRAYAGPAFTSVSGRDRPHGLVGVHIDRVHLLVPGAEVDEVPDHERRGLDHARLEAPELAAGVGVERDDVARCVLLVLPAGERVHERLIDDAFAHGRRRGDAAVEVLLPDDTPGLGVEGEEAAIVRPDVDPAVRDDRRELKQAACPPRPFRREGRPQVEAGRVARSLLVVAVRWPGDLAHDLLGPRRRAGLLSRLELDGARAADRAGVALLPDDVRRRSRTCYEQEHERDDPDDPPPSHRCRLCSTA